MNFTFSLDLEGMAAMEKNKGSLYPNVSYNKDDSSVTLNMAGLQLKCKTEKFMSEVKRLGLLVGNGLIIDSRHITKYPY